MSQWFRSLLYLALVTSLFWGLFSQLDPFGVKSAAALQSESVFMRLIGGPWYQSKMGDQVTVVLIDDQYIKEIKEFWPLPYGDQQKLLESILDFHPKAIFLDLLYQHKHEADDGSLKELVDEISQDTREKKNYVPVFIPQLFENIEGVNTCEDYKETDPASSMIKQDSVIEEIRKSKATTTYIGWAGCGNRYPSFLVRNPDYKTPAFALYDQICKLDNAKRTPGFEKITSGQEEAFNAFKEPMVIHWGTGVSAVHRDMLKEAKISCTVRPANVLERLSYSGSQLWSALKQSTSSSSERGASEQCTYIDTVNATWFLGDGMTDKVHGFLEHMLKDRIVLVGTQLDGIHDNIVSPINGQIPGVYLFAMALDNYLTYGSHYFKSMESWLAVSIEVIVLFSIILLMGCLRRKYLTWLDGKAISEETYVRMGLGLVFYFILKIFIPISICLALAIFMWQCRYAPMDWIGICCISFVANPVTLKDSVYFRKQRSKSLSPLSKKTHKE